MSIPTNTRVVIERLDGGVSIVIPAPKFKGTLEDLIEENVPKGFKYRITTVDKLPGDRTYRDAWTDKNPTDTVDIDLDKAKIIHTDKLRRARDDLWPDFDKRYTAAQRDGKDLTALDEERQTLKDIPNNAEKAMKTMNSIDEIKALAPIPLADGISKGLFEKKKLPPTETAVMPRKEYLEYKKKKAEAKK